MALTTGVPPHVRRLRATDRGAIAMRLRAVTVTMQTIVYAAADNSVVPILAPVGAGATAGDLLVERSA